MDIDAHLAQRVRGLRTAQGHTLDRLAELSGVSRSMISLIERGETSPTAAVLNKLADALGVTLASLFAEETRDVSELPLARLADQPVWTDPASGYVRRQLSPGGYASPIELVEVTFPPGETVAFENVVRHAVTHQQVWMLEGEMKITVGEKTWHLRAGDCLAMVLDQHVAFSNPTRKPARYAVALATLSRNTRNP
jgi:transcriptional regulator with XRE-family HTH domain